MKKIPIKLISVALAASMMLSIAACNKKGGSGFGSGSKDTSHSGKKIAADSPWYNSTKVDVDIDIETDRELEYTYQELAGIDKDHLYVMTSGSYKMPPDNEIDWNNFDYNSYRLMQVSEVERSTGKATSTIDLMQFSTSLNEYVDNVKFENGELTVQVSTYDDVTYEAQTKTLVLDPKTGNVLETREQKTGEDGPGYVEKTFKIGDYSIDTEGIWDDHAMYNLYVHSPDGDTTKIALEDKQKDYYDIPVILGIDENKALVCVSGSGSYLYFELDLKECKIEPADEKKYEWLDLDYCYQSYTGEDGCIYFLSSIGVEKIDMKKKAMETVFDYSWCDVNRSVLTNLSIVEISGDTILLCGENYVYQAYSSNSSSDFCIYEFTKAKTNPHAGKTILELYAPYGYTSDKIADAILKYNSTNEKFFIEVSDRYSDNDDADYSEVNSDDDSEQVSLTSDAKLSSQLAMDILNGEGPDILMNVSYYGQLNSPNYLADLSSYVGNLSSDKYFTNVIDASRVDGKLYNLPICFVVEGIHTDSKYAGKSGIGFTTEEYEKFLNDTLNGTDIINSGQPYYFAKLFNAMSDKFIVNGKADFSSPEFAELADFVKNNVPETAKTWDELYNYDDVAYESFAVGAAIFKGDMGYEDAGPAINSYCYGLSSYLMETMQLQGATAILGYPSADGRGPLLEPYISVAVSAQAYDADACGEFVKMLLSDELQLDFAMKDNFVINREAFRQAGKVCVDYYNGEGHDDFYFDAPKSFTFSEKNIDDMENIILTCSRTNTKDAAINLILIEEMPAYFSGQKDLNSVIKIAQDRVQKVLDERG